MYLQTTFQRNGITYGWDRVIKRLFFKADADTAVVAGPLIFKRWPVSVLPGYTGRNQRTQSETKPLCLTILAEESCSKFEKNVETVREV